MKAADLHAAACRSINEILEDDPRIDPIDLRVLFAVKFADVLRLPPTQQSNITPRLTVRQVRTLVYDVLDQQLPGATVIAIMRELDRVMALRISEKRC